MIEIRKDPTSSLHELPSGALLVRSTSDYPMMCLELRSALEELRSITVVIQSPHVCGWVDNLRRCYPEITVVEYDLLQELRAHLEITALPPDLTPQAVKELGLLDLPKPTEPPIDAKSWILSQLVGGCWGNEAPDDKWQHFVDLINWCLADASPVEGHGLVHELIQKWMTERRSCWVGSCETDVQKAYSWLLADQQLRAKLLLCRQILLPYAEEQVRDWIDAVLGCEHFVPDYVTIQHLPQISRERSLLIGLSERAKAYWRSQLSNGVEIEDALGHMSGELLGELEAISRQLQREPSKGNQELVLRLRHQFSSPGAADALLEGIQTLVSPPKPQKPQEGWDWQDWALWAAHEYLPYREWVHIRNLEDAELDGYSTAYGDWLHAHYPALKNTPEPLVFGAAMRIRELMDEGYVILWVVVDNLPWMCGLRFADEMAKHGLITDNPKCKLSMLPSETETSKRALVGGRLPRDLDPSADYNHLLWAKWEGASIRYEKNKPSLDDLIGRDARLYLYQYDELDPTAHGFVVDRESAVQSKLAFLARAIAKAIEGLSTRFDRIIAVVDSDHGSTLIPKSAKKLDKPPNASSEHKDTHRRFVILSGDADLDTEDWYVLRPAQFGNRDVFAVARGYAYVEKRPLYYTHGGLTPEETIVPHIEFKARAVPDWRPIEVVYSGQPIRPGRAQEATLVARNLNPTGLSNVRLFIQGTVTSPIAIGSEEQARIENVAIMVPSHVRAPEFTVRAYIRFLAYGRLRSQEIDVRIPVRLIAVDAGIDEMFEE